MKKLFTINIYVKVYINKLVVKILDQNVREEVFFPENNFSSQRLLVADFQEAENCLSRAFDSLIPKGFLIRKRPAVVIHAMEMNEGGLSVVEQESVE